MWFFICLTFEFEIEKNDMNEENLQFSSFQIYESFFFVAHPNVKFSTVFFYYSTHGSRCWKIFIQNNERRNLSWKLRKTAWMATENKRKYSSDVVNIHSDKFSGQKVLKILSLLDLMIVCWCRRWFQHFPVPFVIIIKITTLIVIATTNDTMALVKIIHHVPPFHSPVQEIDKREKSAFNAYRSH